MGSSSSIFNLYGAYILVVCEKPAAVQRIAQALGTATVKNLSTTEIARNDKKRWTSSPFFSAVDKKGRQFVICSALGYLYGLVDVGGNRSVYPVFDVK